MNSGLGLNVHLCSKSLSVMRSPFTKALLISRKSNRGIWFSSLWIDLMDREEDYKKREVGEVKTQIYPNFPYLRERAIYKRDCKLQDKMQRKQACQKEFPSHSKLTPGLYLLTCGCKRKSIYGISMMLSGESPSMLFNLVMTRFERDYNPHIIYDATCIAK